MKLLMTLWVRDEEDVIEDNILYHLNQGVDFIIATDNNSTDATPEILERYAAEGVLHLLRDPAEGWQQRPAVTRMARLAATDFGADWVINNDADEFWWPRVGTLKDVFTAVPDRYGALAGRRLNFVPTRHEADRYWERMTVVEMQSLKLKPAKLERSPITPKVAHRASPDVGIGMGNHNVYPRDRFPVVPGWEPIIVFHYPFRSYAQLEKKVTLSDETLELARRERRAVERPLLRELQREGRLREYWDAKALDEPALRAGLEEGGLCVDLRMKRFMSRIEGLPPAGARGGALSPSLADPADLALERAMAVDRALQLERKLARLEGRIVKLERRNEKAESRIAKSKRPRRRLGPSLGRPAR